MSNRIRVLQPSDVPHTLQLSQAAGWNQTREDWSLAIEMNPDGCFAMECDGGIVATTTTIRYGTDLAWIGMVLTHPEFRGRGFARALMKRAIEHLSDVRTVKLDATEMGKPLYTQLGFAEECAIERWLRSPQGTSLEAMWGRRFRLPVTLDYSAFGADRSPLLHRLAQIEAASHEDAFAMGRGVRFGPCVSQSKESACVLAKEFLARHANQQLIWDLFPENNLAQELGFEQSRRLTRMVLGRELKSRHELIYACAGFEFG
jgi:GNAT superfamily N-acetyltransferase